jgi:hypothetical protein
MRSFGLDRGMHKWIEAYTRTMYYWALSKHFSLSLYEFIFHLSHLYRITVSEAVAFFRVLLYHLPGGTDANHEQFNKKKI